MQRIAKIHKPDKTIKAGSLAILLGSGGVLPTSPKRFASASDTAHRFTIFHDDFSEHALLQTKWPVMTIAGQLDAGAALVELRRKNGLISVELVGQEPPVQFKIPESDVEQMCARVYFRLDVRAV